MKSGYSTKILVHKEGIMTNEEIFKLADKALKNQGKKCNSIIVATLFIYAIGITLINVPCDISDISWDSSLAVLFAVISLAVYFYYASKYIGKYFKIRREFICNLVRKDERMRIKNGTL